MRGGWDDIGYETTQDKMQETFRSGQFRKFALCFGTKMLTIFW
jgi:hypothetical protein